MTEAARARMGGGAAAAAWVALCLSWFDVRGQSPSPAGPLHALLALALLAAAAVLYARRRGEAPPASSDKGLLLVVGLAVLFRLPLAWQGAAGYLTPDGALSGIVALHVRDGSEHLVFVPSVPYSGSLKSHFTAPLAALIDPARAFALVSVGFYAAFVAAVHRLARLSAGQGASIPVAAGMYLAFAPAFVTRYSLSNDGNYVEVLALGTWALALAVEWTAAPRGGGSRPWAIGVLLGLAFWCHILALIHILAIALLLLLRDPRAATGAAPRIAAGFALGDLPGLFWNAHNGGESFRYLLPGGPDAAGGPAAPVAGKLLSLAGDHLLVLLGYDPGYRPVIDGLLKALAGLALVLVLVGMGHAVRAASRGSWALLAVVLLFVVNLALAAFALPYIPGNPRYLLFSTATVAVVLASLGGRFRLVLALLVAAGALGSLGQALPTLRSDRQWRSFVSALQAEGVRWCHTDFHLATKVNFLSDERIVCSSKLGPTITEYFFRYRQAVEAAPEAALIAVNPTAAEKLQRRLERLGVASERRDLMKPVLLRLSRKVDPQELFPEREFPWR